MTAPKLYAVVIADNGLHLVGPFATLKDMERWGAPRSDPRWQSVSLTDAQIASPLLVLEPPASIARAMRA